MCVLIQAGNASGRTFPREQGWGGAGRGEAHLSLYLGYSLNFFF